MIRSLTTNSCRRRPRRRRQGLWVHQSSMSTAIPFLFDPAEVAKYLEGLPNVAVALCEPASAGQMSGVFHEARESAREIYRVLGNVHYAHLDALLRTLDFCLARGFAQPTILRTRARKPFTESLAELHAAEHFL